MGALFKRKDGRIRAGLVSLIIIGTVLGISSLLLEKAATVQTVRMKITQVFSPASKNPSERELPPPPAPDPVAGKEQRIADQKDATDGGDVVETAAVQSSGTPPTAEVSTAPSHDPPASEASETKSAAPASAPANQQTAGGAEAAPIATGRLPLTFSDKTETREGEETRIAVKLPLWSGEKPPREAPAKEASRKKPETDASDAKPPARKAEDDAITVDKETYMHLLRAWHSSGNELREGTLPALRVENLLDTHVLFHMKPVAVDSLGTTVDLADGSRLPEGALSGYSSTVFEVEDPWSSWGSKMKAAGIREAAACTVRYHIYESIRKALFARALRAVEWGKTRELIPATTDPGKTDVLARAYRIAREGGGAFGVILPIAVDLPDGTRVPVSAEAFNGDPDVDALRSAGALARK
jgi:hypothetical protein